VKILFLATYFPRPLNERIGPWALEQAKAFAAKGAKVQVESLNPILPPGISRVFPRFRAYASVPEHWNVNQIQVNFPRWPYIATSAFEARLKSFRWKYMSLAWKFARKPILRRILSWKPDLIYAHHTLVNGWIALQLHRETGIPYVITDHATGDILKCDTNPVQKKIFQQVSKYAAATVAVSNTMEREMKRRFPEANSLTIYNGGGFEDLNHDVLEKPSLKDGIIRVFCCANFYPRKGIPLLIQAFDQVAGDFPNISLRIAGSGPDQHQIVLTNSQNRSAIQLLGALNKADVKTEMAVADIFALTGWAEPFGVVFLEAMSAGCALLLSEDAGVAEILEHQKTAWFIKPRDKDSIVSGLRHLLGHPDQMRSSGRNAYHQYKGQLGWSNAALNYLQLFENVIGKVSKN